MDSKMVFVRSGGKGACCVEAEEEAKKGGHGPSGGC